MLLGHDWRSWNWGTAFRDLSDIELVMEGVFFCGWITGTLGSIDAKIWAENHLWQPNLLNWVMLFWMVSKICLQLFLMIWLCYIKIYLLLMFKKWIELSRFLPPNRIYGGAFALLTKLLECIKIGRSGIKICDLSSMFPSKLSSPVWVLEVDHWLEIDWNNGANIFKRINAFCANASEDVTHLFFGCSFSEVLRDAVLRLWVGTRRRWKFFKRLERIDFLLEWGSWLLLPLLTMSGNRQEINNSIVC